MTAQNTITLDPHAEELFANLERLWEYADSEMSDKTFTVGTDLRLVILASVTAATHRIIRGIIKQVRNDSVDGIDVLLRTLVEGMINVKYILEDSAQMRARAYVVDDLRDRLAAIRRLIPMLDRGTARGMSTVTDVDRYRELEQQLRQEREELVNQFGEDNLRFPPLEQRARASGAEELYATAFWLLSLDSHLTARGLDRYMSEQQGNIRIELGQDLIRTSMQFRTAYIIYCALLNECINYFGIPSRESFNKFDFIPQ